MNDLVILLRMAQLYTHNAHNLVKGTAFFEDHKFLGELYPVYEEAYDSVVERMIGNNQTIDLIQVQKRAAESLSFAPEDKGDGLKIFKYILFMEEHICALIESIKQSVSEGTKQLLGDIANASEIRQYKLKQRIK